MELRHYINETEIDEPIGFDGFETKIARHDGHGMSVEVSVGTLEFYGRAYALIEEAFETDIDTALTYSVHSGDREVYSGVIDLTTCAFLDADYRSVSANVANIGPSTTFNNRIDTAVDIDGAKNIDDAEMEPTAWHLVGVPLKHLKYTNKAVQEEDAVYINSFDGDQPDSLMLTGNVFGYHNCVYFPIGDGDDKVNEFGEFTVAETCGTEFHHITDERKHHIAYYTSNTDPNFCTTYGRDTEVELEVELKVTFEFSRTNCARLTCVLDDGGFYDYDENEIGTYQFTQAEQDDGGEFTYSVHYKLKTAELASCDPLYPASPYGAYLKMTLHDCAFENETPEMRIFKVKVHAGSYVKMTMYDNLAYGQTESRMYDVKDVMQHITSGITNNELQAVSDYYTTGEGALRVITNGYKLRGLYPNQWWTRTFPLSFKALFEALCAIDCVGWGIVGSRQNSAVRIEKWEWFYKDNTLLTFAGVPSVTRNMSAEDVVTEFSCGYSNHETTEEFDAIDSLHGTRQFVSGIKAVSTTLEAGCEFIADNYAIEVTNRARYSLKDDQEFDYDESVFIFQCAKQGNRYILRLPSEAELTQFENVPQAADFYNYTLTPRTNAARWQSFLFRSNSDSPLRFSTGTLGYDSKVCVDGVAAREDADIQRVPCKLTAERIEFEAPVGLDEYKAILANPYDKIEVNGIRGWIEEFTYSFADGMGKFKLIKERIKEETQQ